ncbi:pyridoxamine 5'-phosphate oxidase family protein [Pseudonocardia sulfidoxydans]|uniref:pyridoxamine 5'-phosphate oxidase family protein n=1 Tax=Pseudonocardia sulfidoxydans TaxID=54011 RepID=UPI0011BDB8D4|nr:pyridoxamine 5'-phosphate oxidase family protein [Pseudonocardia sulfidoxydans]
MPDKGFHGGERLAQHRAGVTAEADRLAGMLTTQHITEGMSRFLADQELAFITGEDQGGLLWTSPISGPRGFCTGSGPGLLLAGGAADGDPLQSLRDGQALGVLFVDFARRRRLRINGVISNADAGGIDIAVEQAFGNCPRHIVPRSHQWSGSRNDARDHSRHRRLAPEHLALIAAAHTFILGTAHPARGADTSHRGGAPGFVRWTGNELWWPDYVGNNLFNSIGNIVTHPSTSLLFVDFQQQASLQISGHGAVEWEVTSHLENDEETGRRVRVVPAAIVHSRRF